MSELIKALRPASFRGVAFSVDAADGEFGRRVEVHEYPQRDKPYVEDLGRASRSFSIDGLIVGVDYIERANKLIAELEKPGAGALVHPWLGSMQVVLVGSARVRFEARGLGVARIQMTFTEAGELAFPSVQTSTPAASRLTADKLTAASVAQAARSFNVVGVSDFVAAAASSQVGQLATKITKALPGLPSLGDARKWAKLGAEWVGLIRDPSSLMASIAGGMGIAQYIGQAADLRAVVNGFLRFAGGGDIRQPLPPTVFTGSRQQAWANQVALNGLTRQIALAQAIGASSLASASVYDDAVAMRAGLVAAIDAESLNASDEVYRALLEARAAVWADLTARSRDSSRLRTVRPIRSTPALVLSHQLYGSASRADEVVERNRVRHPGFVPPVDLRVLS